MSNPVLPHVAATFNLVSSVISGLPGVPNRNRSDDSFLHPLIWRPCASGLYADLAARRAAGVALDQYPAERAAFSDSHTCFPAEWARLGVRMLDLC